MSVNLTAYSNKMCAYIDELSSKKSCMLEIGDFQVFGYLKKNAQKLSFVDYKILGGNISPKGLPLTTSRDFDAESVKNGFNLVCEEAKSGWKKVNNIAKVAIVDQFMKSSRGLLPHADKLTCYVKDNALKDEADMIRFMANNFKLSDFMRVEQTRETSTQDRVSHEFLCIETSHLDEFIKKFEFELKK